MDLERSVDRLRGEVERLNGTKAAAIMAGARGGGARGDEGRGDE